MHTTTRPRDHPGEGAEEQIKIALDIYHQRDTAPPGTLVWYEIDEVAAEMSFPQMLDVLNDQLTEHGEDRWRSIPTAARASAGCAG